MARVYVSSTLADLEPERKAVMEWLVQADHQPVHSYRPDSDTVRDSCLADIDRCALYVLILGHRYGFVPEGADNPEGLSITHLEYRRAVERRMPRVLLLRKNVPDIRLTDWGDPQRMQRVDAFRREVAAHSRPSEFGDLMQLVKDLSTGVQNALIERGAPARTNDASPPLPIPKPKLRQPLHPIIGRDELVGAVVAGLDAGLRRFAFEYLPGVGKTALAAQLVRNKSLAARFPDGMLWAHLGKEPNIQRQLEQWARELGVPDEQVRSCAGPRALSGLLERVIADRRMLLVIDDVWTTPAGEYFSIGGEHSACVLTTRHSQVSRDLATAQGVIRVRKLGPSQSFDLLAEIAPDAAALAPAALRTLANHVDGLPIGLVLVGNRLKKARNRKAIQAILQSVSAIYRDERAADDKDVAADPQGGFRDRHLDELIEASYQALGSSDAMNRDALDGDMLRQALQRLSVLRPDPAWFDSRLAAVVTQLPDGALDDLADAGVIEPFDVESVNGACADDDRYTMHRVIAAYIRKKLPEPVYRELNRRVADHYLEELQALEERYQEGGSDYRAMYRYEDPQWTHCQDNWLYYLARTGNDAEGGLAFLRAWVDGFWWWSCFTGEGFDFCDQLLREWDHRLRLKRAVADPSLAGAGAADERARRSTRGLELLRSFKLAYPKEFPRGSGRRQGSWSTVEESLQELRRLVGIDGDAATLPNGDARHVRAMTDVFLAEAARFGRGDIALAESYYGEALQLLRDSGEQWNIAWLLYHLADMLSSCGRDAESGPLCEEALGLAAGGDDPDHEVAANLHRVLGDGELHRGRIGEAGRHYQRAIECAYRFQVEPQDPDDYTVQFYADIAQQVAGRLIEARARDPAQALAAAWQLRQAWADRGAELDAIPERDALLQADTPEVLAPRLSPPTLPLERLARDGNAYASRVRRQLGIR